MLFGGFIYDFGAWRADKRIGAAIAADGAKAAVTIGGGRADSALTGAHIDVSNNNKPVCQFKSPVPAAL
jgi:hypothetical protein